MRAFCDTIKSQVSELIDERADDMLEAWQESIAEANDNEAKFPPLKIGIAATVDLEKSVVKTVVSFAVKFQSELVAPLPDPDQPELPGVSPAEKYAADFVKRTQKSMKKGESMTISMPDGPSATIHGQA